MLLQECSAGGVWSSFKHCRLEVEWGWSGKGKTIPCGTDRLWIREGQWFWWASLVAQTVKNLPAMQETQVQSLGQEDSLEKGMTTHPSILAWRIPWTEEPGGLQSMGSQSQDLPYQNAESLKTGQGLCLLCIISVSVNCFLQHLSVFLHLKQMLGTWMSLWDTFLPKYAEAIEVETWTFLSGLLQLLEFTGCPVALSSACCQDTYEW